MTAAAPPSWDPTAAAAACSLVPWTGHVWRCHARRYAGDDAGGSLKVSGRYHRGRDRFPAPATWPALYTALAQHIALGERIRHTTPAALSRLAEQRISRLRVSLQAVLNACPDAECVEPAIPGLTLADVCLPTEYRTPQALAAAARRRGAEALLVPSCTRFRGGNLIIFPDALRPGSAIAVEDTEDPDLFVDWDSLR